MNREEAKAVIASFVGKDADGDRKACANAALFLLFQYLDDVNSTAFATAELVNLKLSELGRI